MDKVFHRAEDKNVATRIIYANSSKELFYDSSFENPVYDDETVNLFTKGVTAVYDSKYYAPKSVLKTGFLEFAFSNPLGSMYTNADIPDDADLLGATLESLQQDISIKGNVISGILHHKTGYTGFSPGTPELQEGHYLVLKTAVPLVDDVTITVDITNATIISHATLDSDGILIFRVTNKDTQTLKFTASASGATSVEKTYTLTGLILE